jgi:hypothetical protein
MAKRLTANTVAPWWIFAGGRVTGTTWMAGSSPAMTSDYMFRMFRLS